MKTLSYISRDQDLKRRLVDPLFEKLVISADVIAQLRSRADLAEEVRDRAIRIAQGLSDDPNDLNTRAWEIVRSGDRAREEYAKALRAMEIAAAAEPESWYIVNTFGAAQFRCGKFVEAATTLERSMTLASDENQSHPADLAFLAMARFRLGELDKARELLVRLRERMREGEFATSEEWRSLLEQAEGLIDPENAKK